MKGLSVKTDNSSFSVGVMVRINMYVVIFISIIHPRCINEVFSDATVFIADFGLFLHHISSDSNPGMTLEEPSRLRDRDVLRSCLYQSKEKFKYLKYLYDRL